MDFRARSLGSDQEPSMGRSLVFAEKLRKHVLLQQMGRLIVVEHVFGTSVVLKVALKHI